ncbi:uncharacterized protein PpBr36_11053, partial [Pyricularia pennisetigena]|uniref:uncharacterized protein n=1 Tax=Pyricularia pennisetigena TaxID=1578925 RepID=UPI00114EF1F7
RSTDKAYGRHDNWLAVATGETDALEKAIRCGGLSVAKSRVIISILNECMARHGAYSLDHLQNRSDEEATRELLAFKGVGPKTAGVLKKNGRPPA